MSLHACFPRRLAVAFSIALELAGTACSNHYSNGYEGYVEGKYVYVASPQAGRLDELSVSRGQSVEIGGPLFSLERDPEAAVALQAEQLLRADVARLQDMRTGKRPPEVDTVRAQLAQAEAEQQKAIDLLKSYEQQYAAGGLAETDLIVARAAVESNTAVVRQFQYSIAVAELPGRSEQISAQSQIVEADRAALRQAQWKLQQKQVSAPRNGLVFDTLYRQGEYVNAGSPVVQILPPENIEVRFFVSQALVGGLTVGQPVAVHCDGCGAPVPARITFISNQVEYTPPVIYSNENRSKLVMMIIAKPSVERAASLHPGQPLEVTLR
ncbi:MAG TPA: HlyD family efflux transporter periplasmic adaptor subunit [Terriglobales bacterium]|nr:HlyD family efflux transporter periplasmic adaptor subunit [Dongiaceae bacterium]HVO61398.1 HlyD family efflux transporter periplasmic adaptor subunit [Terriglobales bacterium]